MDVFKHIKSKGKFQLKMAELCQPVKFPPAPGIIWQSVCVAIREEPRLQTHNIESLYSKIRSKTSKSMKDTLESIIPGGHCVWKEPRSLLGKESVSYLKIDFHDDINFFALFVNEHRFKRITSITVHQFLNTNNSFNFDDHEIVFQNSKHIDMVRVSDPEIFLGLAMLYCYSETRY
jgi:hypothetical protein